MPHLPPLLLGLELSGAGVHPASWRRADSRAEDLFDARSRWREADEAVEVVSRLWDSWEDDAEIRDTSTGRFIDRDKLHYIDVAGEHFSVKGPSITPRPPQGQPPVAVRAADPHSTRVAVHRADRIRRQQVTPQTAIAFLEQVWGRDLSAYDPDGPLPDIDPAEDVNITRGRVRHARDPRAIAEAWRARAEAEQLSIGELIIATTARRQFVGTPRQVAAEIDHYVQSDAADGFVLVPHLTPTGLDELVEKVVPELQSLGSFRTEYTGTTLRDHLGLRHPHHGTEGVRAS